MNSQTPSFRLNRYVAKNFIHYLLVITIILSMLIFIGEFIENLRLNSQRMFLLNLGTIIKIASYRIYNFLYKLWPIAISCATTITYTRMCYAGKITSARSFGADHRYFIFPVVFVWLFLYGAHIYIFLPLNSKFMQISSLERDKITTGNINSFWFIDRAHLSNACNSNKKYRVKVKGGEEISQDDALNQKIIARKYDGGIINKVSKISDFQQIIQDKPQNEIKEIIKKDKTQTEDENMMIYQISNCYNKNSTTSTLSCNFEAYLPYFNGEVMESVCVIESKEAEIDEGICRIFSPKIIIFTKEKIKINTSTKLDFPLNFKPQDVYNIQQKAGYISFFDIKNSLQRLEKSGIQYNMLKHKLFYWKNITLGMINILLIPLCYIIAVSGYNRRYSSSIPTRIVISAVIGYVAYVFLDYFLIYLIT